MAIKIHRGPARGSFPQPPAPKLFRNIAVTFVLITIAVIAIAVWTSAVKAKVVVTVKRSPISVDTVVDLALSPAINQIQGRVVSGSFAESKEFPVETVSSTTPVVVIPTVTKGKVKIINNYSKDQPLVEKTRLLTPDNKLYRITKTINVPAGGSVTVDAVSDQAGNEFAIGAGIHMTIPGLWEGLQKQIYAESVTPFTGNAVSNGPIKVLTQGAVSKAYDELYAAALEKAKQSLALEAGAVAGWESVLLVNDSKKQSNTAVGQQADSFLAQVKITVTAVYFPKDDVAALVQTRLKDKLPEGYSLSDVDPAKILFRLDSADDKKNTAKLVVSAEASSQLTADSSVLRKDLIVGLPEDEVVRKWSALDGVQSVDVILQPNWVHRLPSMKDKITIEIR